MKNQTTYSHKPQIGRWPTIFLLLPCLAWVLSACEENFFPELEQATPILVVDAWINNKPEVQTIKLTYTQPYFEATAPAGISNAIVFVTDEDSNRFDFFEGQETGVYKWMPDSITPQLGQIGIVYSLFIEVNGQNYYSSSIMNRVPEMDSVTFRLQEGNNFFPTSYFAEFYARDLKGLGDTYWIKAWKNGEFLNKPNEINIAFDASFSAGGKVDGIYFIQPIRDAINPFDQDENDEFLSPYNPGDSVYVEIHSITYDAFTYLNELKIQTDRPGGFAELFAVPLSNIPTNIENRDPKGDTALGFFCISAVTLGGKMLDPDNLPE